MGMIKADSRTLEALFWSLIKETEEFSLKMMEVSKISLDLEKCWDAKTYGPFREVMMSIRAGVNEVEDACFKARQEIGEMISIVKEYESKKFR